MFTESPGIISMISSSKRSLAAPFNTMTQFVLILVVPEVFGGCVTVRHDPLDAHVGGFEQRGEKLVGQVRRQVSEEVEWDQLKASSCKAIQICSQASSTSISPSRLRDALDGTLR